jgi:hypothetical protein
LLGLRPLPEQPTRHQGDAMSAAHRFVGRTAATTLGAGALLFGLPQRAMILADAI